MEKLKLSEIFDYFGIDQKRKDYLSQIAFDYSCHMRDRDPPYKSKGYDDEWGTYDDMVKYVLEFSPSLEDKVHLLFELFELFPTYGHTMMAIFFLTADGSIPKANEKFQEQFWKKLISYFLSPEKAYRFASDYMLGIELLESDTTIQYAWNSIREYGGNSFAVNELLLINSSAVNMELKVDLYKELIKDSRYHMPILRSMYYSVFGYYGKFSTSDAMPFLNQLTEIDLNSEEASMLAWFTTTKEKTMWHKSKG